MTRNRNPVLIILEWETAGEEEAKGDGRQVIDGLLVAILESMKTVKYVRIRCNTS
jgi:hypothetical protein